MKNINFFFILLFFFSSSLLCDQISHNFFEARNTANYEEKFYRYQNSEVGKEFLKSLSYLQVMGDKLFKTKSIEKKEVIEEEKNLHKREMNQYNKFQKEHSKMIPIVSHIRKAVKEVFGDVSLKLEKTRKRDRFVKMMKKIKAKVLSLFRRKKKKEIIESKISVNTEKEIEILENSVILDNLLTAMEHLKKSLSEDEYNELVNNSTKLAKKLVRPDMLMQKEEFEKFYLGFVKEGGYVKKNDLEKFLKDVSSQSFLQYDDKPSGGSQSNYCSSDDRICDRRKYSDSCESRIDVEDQGGCGTCWLFAGLQLLELYHCMATGKDTIYSKQEMLDCTPERTCSLGANFFYVMRTLTQRRRISDAKSYPYETEKRQCKSNKPNVWTGTFSTYQYTEHPEVIINRYRLKVDLKTWIGIVKKYISVQGGVYASIYAADEFRYSEGVINTCAPQRDATNHAVLVTGWTKVNGVHVWIVRNSWGRWWKDDGYTYFAMVNKVCKQETEPLSEFYLLPKVTWSDEKVPYKVIPTHTKQGGDVIMKSKRIMRGGEDVLSCPESKVIHIEQALVVDFSKATADKAMCSSLKVKEKCENLPACRLQFPRHMCGTTYNLLVVHYQCTAIARDFDCEYAKSGSAGMLDDFCKELCKQAASSCNPVTKSCLSELVDDFLCDLKNVITS